MKRKSAIHISFSVDIAKFEFVKTFIWTFESRTCYRQHTARSTNQQRHRHWTDSRTNWFCLHQPIDHEPFGLLKTRLCCACESRCTDNCTGSNQLWSYQDGVEWEFCGTEIAEKLLPPSAKESSEIWAQKSDCEASVLKALLYKSYILCRWCTCTHLTCTLLSLILTAGVFHGLGVSSLLTQVWFGSVYWAHLMLVCHPIWHFVISEAFVDIALLPVCQLRAVL